MKSWKLGSPPRRRGKDKAEHLVQDHIGITPAQAGKRCYLCASTKSSWDHPRVGGEKAKITPRLKRCRGSPPHGRGKVAQKVHKGGKSRITPAWAGKSKSLYSGGRGHRDHPRMGGEKHAGRFKKLVGWGSPPHGRGKVQACPEDSPASGITPAWAGKRQPRRPSSRDRRDHPRMGGEKMPFALVTAPESGSPPHGRGKVNTVTNSVPSVRITPAWAGKSDR